MKELTHKEWMENPTPRMMWVWDSNEAHKKQMKVVYFSNTAIEYPVVALTNNDVNAVRYKHCAEIEKQRRMTNKELARWLRLNPTREIKYDRQCDRVYYNYNYYDSESNKEVDTELVIRENDGEWREPLIEEDNTLWA